MVDLKIDSAARPIVLGSRTALQALPPLSVYVHIPWCLRKCPYCDFNSHELRGELAESDYVAALIADLEAALPNVWGRKVYSVFFGGGTPSLLSPGALDQILTALHTRLPLAPDAEITLEANPGTFEARKFRAFRDLGINRLSIGIQSFNAEHLQALGRVHDATQAQRAIDIAQRCFDNINLDLMYALPRQSMDQALADIRQAIAYAPAHISAYHLTLEPNTLFHQQPPPLPDDDTAADMQQAIELTLAQAGYEHYETSAFAQAGKRCRHNLNYWQFGDYLGIGAGAHSKISFTDRILRQMRYKQPQRYMRAAQAGAALQEEHEVASKDLPFEFMMNALRLIDGVPAALLQERTGISMPSVQRQLELAERDGLLERDHRTLKPSARGQRFLNELLQRFLPA